MDWKKKFYGSIILLGVVVSYMKGVAVEYRIQVAMCVRDVRLFLRFQDTVKDTAYEYVKTVTESVEGHREVVVIKTREKDSITMVKMLKENMKPINYQKINIDGTLQMRMEYLIDKVHILAPEKGMDKMIHIREDTFDKSSVMDLLQACLIHKKIKKMDFNFVINAGNWGFRVVEMCAKTTGLEEVTVPAGTYQCRKVELRAAGLIGKLFWRTRYYYYFRDDFPHHFVKYSGPDGESIELLKYEIIN